MQHYCNYTLLPGIERKRAREREREREREIGQRCETVKTQEALMGQTGDTMNESSWPFQMSLLNKFECLKSQQTLTKLPAFGDLHVGCIDKVLDGNVLKTSL